MPVKNYMMGIPAGMKKAPGEPGFEAKIGLDRGLEEKRRQYLY